ncbi:glycosyltransferase family 2 protein [Paucibacter sp. DJ2R-2]|uniref:glycosyltransferase family 2 protein n=1 Tax=Paucibacter sp. DJ2R-2 TaxID=2893558 RepID=UPI0021E38799|nr:glycosyltransferase family 2 protein [Paucibacter sp. DJ2R-2]MCV2423100.1 glycosyltransferase [Paucibacter sp. DJ4R-1]MCV2440996.1 glycosyltransferase [Paucibacter sp. DJ2R-2]
MNKTNPLLTIVTPTYNQANYLEETIESVLSQDYTSVEYIVINDGSTDGTEKLLEKYAHRITVINQKNAGQATTLNRGWGAANGEYLSYLSSDDKLHPQAFSRLIAVLERDPSIACVYPNSNLINENSETIKKNVCLPFDLEKLVIQQECHIGPGAIFRTEAFRKIGGWKSELRLAPDREFWMRLASTGKFEFINEALAEYRLHSASISYKEISERVSEEYITVLDGYYSADNLPSGLLSRKSEAYAYANLLITRNLLRAGKIRKGLSRYRLACELHPPLSKLSTKALLLRNIVSKPLHAFAAKAKSLVS